MDVIKVQGNCFASRVVIVWLGFSVTNVGGSVPEAPFIPSSTAAISYTTPTELAQRMATSGDTALYLMSYPLRRLMWYINNVPGRS